MRPAAYSTTTIVSQRDFYTRGSTNEVQRIAPVFAMVPSGRLGNSRRGREHRATITYAWDKASIPSRPVGGSAFVQVENHCRSTRLFKRAQMAADAPSGAHEKVARSATHHF